MSNFAFIDESNIQSPSIPASGPPPPPLPPKSVPNAPPGSGEPLPEATLVNVRNADVVDVPKGDSDNNKEKRMSARLLVERVEEQVGEMTITEDFNRAVASHNEKGGGLTVAKKVGVTDDIMPSTFLKKNIDLGDKADRLRHFSDESLGRVEFIEGELFVGEGYFLKYNRRNVVDKKYFFLTTHSLRYGQRDPKTKRYKPDFEVPLTSVVVRFPRSDEKRNEKLDGMKTFLVMTPRKSFHARAIDLGSEEQLGEQTANTERMCDEWRKLCQETQIKKNGVALADDRFTLWSVRASGTDGATQCKSCSCAFTMLRRRHHCRACGCPVCASCSREKMMLDYDLEKRPRRVCDTCADHLKDSRKYGAMDESIYS